MDCTNQFNLRADPEIGQFSLSIINGKCQATAAFGGAALDNEITLNNTLTSAPKIGT